MAFTQSGDPFLFPLQEQGLKTDAPTITVRCIDPVVSLSWWNSDSLFIPKSQSTLDGQLQRHYQGHLAIKWDWLGYVGWRRETAGLQPQSSWPGCMWHQHMQVDSVWWERCCRKGGCYSNAGWFWVLLFSSVPIGNLCGTCSKPYGSVWGAASTPVCCCCTFKAFRLWEVSWQRLPRCFQWVACGETSLLDGTWFPKAAFPSNGDVWKKRSKTLYWKFISLIPLCHPQNCSVCTVESSFLSGNSLLMFCLQCLVQTKNRSCRFFCGCFLLGLVRTFVGCISLTSSLCGMLFLPLPGWSAWDNEGKQ